MAAPLGNKNAAGKHKKGAGRKTLRNELSDWEELQTLWDEPLPSKEEVRQLLTDDKRKFTTKELMKIKLALGNDRALLAIFDKRFPDKLLAQVQNQKRRPLVIFDI